MSKRQEEPERFIYVKDPELSEPDFDRFEDADRKRRELGTKYTEPQYRIQVRMRSRTNRWDVLVKVRRPAPTPEKTA